MKRCRSMVLALSLLAVLCLVRLERNLLVSDLVVERTPRLASPPPSLSPTTTTLLPGGAYPIWNSPLPGQPTVSTAGDFEWIFPTIAPNQSEYAKHRYVANEFNQCDGKTGLCCSLGATAKGYGGVGAGCRWNRMNLMAEFRPLPHRELFSLVDALLAWRLAHPERTNFYMLFIGDSVCGQVFMGALCELARNSKVESITYNDAATNQTFTTKDFQESHVKLVGLGGFDFTLRFIRQYRWTPNRTTLGAFFASADVAVIGLGLHYQDSRRTTINSILDLVVSELSQKSITVLWMGAPRQHFRFELNNTQVTGKYEENRGLIQFCGPVARYPLTHPNYEGVNGYVFDYLTNTLNVSASWFRWSAVSRTSGIHFLPFAELTAPFYQNYRSYKSDPRQHSRDCGHLCWAPNFYEPYWDALYLIVAANKSSPAVQRFPAGTQQFPPMVVWNQTLQFKTMLEHS
ncbi:hypothetical protein BASA81_011047 [Batrachochytrium salamandrivorans]|nr:hypothetical protein BASA81_011047 [Batrachochytrium salamandrivorans]